MARGQAERLVPLLEEVLAEARLDWAISMGSAWGLGRAILPGFGSLLPWRVGSRLGLACQLSA